MLNFVPRRPVVARQSRARMSCSLACAVCISHMSFRPMETAIVYALCAVVLSVAFSLCCNRLFRRSPVCRGGGRTGEAKLPIQEVLKTLGSGADVRYEIRDAPATRTTGWKLWLQVRLLYTRYGHHFIVPNTKKGSIGLMGGVYIPEKPTLYPTPLVPPGTTDYSKVNEGIIRRMLDKETEGKQSQVGFRFPTVADYIRAFSSGACTPTDIAKAVLSAIEDSNKASPPLRAIVDTNREVVLAMAEASTKRWRTGKTLSVLDGVPVTIKGEFFVEPYKFRSGAKFVSEIAKHVPKAVIVQNLREAGSVIIGVANMQEFGLGLLGSNTNELHQTARNPYNPHCYAGGSSSGSTASVAAGLCPVAIGTDGGGSVRAPAGICGVVGLKPTFGCVDSRGVLPIAHSVSSPGCIGSSVLDTAIILDTISRQKNGVSKPLSLEGLGRVDLTGVTVGVYWEFFEHADQEIVEKCKRAVEQLHSLGAKIVEIKIPELEENRVAHVVSIVTEILNALSVDVDKHFHEINLESLLPLGAFNFTAVEFLNAQKQRTRALATLQHLFQEVDILATPGTACVAPEILQDSIPLGVNDAYSSLRLQRFSFLANLTGIPGIVVPVGYTREDLPISLQLMGRWYEERVLLKAAWALENSGAFPLKKPQIFYNLLSNYKSGPNL